MPDPRASRPPARQARLLLDGAPVRVLDLGPAPGLVGAAPPVAHVVVVPGLGLLGYLLPTVRELARRGAWCTVLDLPGFGTRSPLSAPPTLTGVATLAAAYLRTLPEGERVVLLGHSTGAQAAVHAARLAQDHRLPAAVVLAGPTVAPGQRTLPRLVATAPAAYRRDSPGELVVVPDLLRANRHLLPLLRSALADRPEVTVAALRSPVTLTAGEQDAFAPAWWLRALRRSAVGAAGTDLVVLPGSHNNPWTHPVELADVVLRAPDVGLPARPVGGS